MADNDKTIIMGPDGKTASVATSMKVAHAGQINNTTTTETAAITGSPANKCYAPTLYLHTAEDMAKMSATTYNHSSSTQQDSLPPGSIILLDKPPLAINVILVMKRNVMMVNTYTNGLPLLLLQTESLYPFCYQQRVEQQNGPALLYLEAVDIYHLG
jgi:hypothetical protein